MPDLKYFVAVEPRPGWPSLVQGTLSFVPFGLGMVAAMAAAEYPFEVTPNLRLYRTIYSAWLALALLIPALGLFIIRGIGPSWWNAWRLDWTFSFLAYAVHLYYAWFGLFESQLPLVSVHPELYGVGKGATTLDLVVAHQSPPIAYSNLVVSALWAIDTLLSWLIPGERGGRGGWALLVERWVTWAWVLASAVVSSVYFPKHLVSVVLGSAIVASIVLSLLVRISISILGNTAPAVAPNHVSAKKVRS